MNKRTLLSRARIPNEHTHTHPVVSDDEPAAGLQGNTGAFISPLARTTAESGLLPRGSPLHLSSTHLNVGLKAMLLVRNRHTVIRYRRGQVSSRFACAVEPQHLHLEANHSMGAPH